MIRVEATYYDGVTSAPHRAQLTFSPTGSVVVCFETGRVEFQSHEINISTRVANTPRSLYFADGSKCESVENDKIDEFVESQREAASGSWLHLLESSWRHVAIITVLTVVIVGVFIKVGIPSLAESAAYAIPSSIDVELSEQVLASLDKVVFETSTIVFARREQLRSYLHEITAAVGGEHRYTLEFRSSEKTGANAFALPSGIIIITDELLELAQDDREVIAVLAHEVGHVVNRHVLRRVIQSSVVALLIGTLTGDVVSVSTFAATIPAALMEAKYSREFEIEADRFAIQYLSRKNISPQHYANILERLDQSQSDKKRATGFLDTHPTSNDRIELLKE